MVSIYCKDELATWEELYQFIQDGVYHYDPNNDKHSKLDPYWKRPFRKLMLTWFCNQLNKNTMENNLTELKFILVDDNTDASCDLEIPKIYTCKIPSTGRYSDFIVNDHPRIDIDSLVGKVRLILLIDNVPQPDEIMISTILKLFDSLLTYYKEPIGWKDPDGNLLYSNQSHECGIGGHTAVK